MNGQPTAVMVSTPDRLDAIRERLASASGRSGQSWYLVSAREWATRYADDVSFLLELLDPRLPGVTVDTTRLADGPHTLFDAAGEPTPLVPLDQSAIPTTRTDAHTTSRAAGELGALGRHTSLRYRLARQFYLVSSTARLYAQVEGLTDEEAARRAGITRGTPWARCTELRAGGWLFWTGETRPSSLGNEAKVWAMTEEGMREYQRLCAERGVEPGL